MGKYLHRFETDAEFGQAYNGYFYHEPWVSLTVENGDVNYNKTLQETPVTFEILSGGNFYWLTTKTHSSQPADVNIGIWYKINNGEWTEIENKTVWDRYNGQEITSITPNFVVNPGDIVQFKGYNSVVGSPDYAGLAHGFFTDENVRFNARGNIMSLISGDNFSRLDTLDSGYSAQFANVFAGCSGLVSTTELLLPATTLSSRCYVGMFSACINLTQAPDLPATTLAGNCYEFMFGYCESLTQAPELPATNLASACYNFMFNGCRNLTKAPNLPATTLVEYCYSYMFSNCTSLTVAPTLPATNLAEGCYSNMFSNCTSLTVAPALPATTLANNCYSNMFSDCENLTVAPALPATTLANNCYSNMFGYCTNLNYIKCLATDISASSCTNNWVNGVSSTGTFVKASSMSSWTTGYNGIPTGWTVQTA